MTRLFWMVVVVAGVGLIPATCQAGFIVTAFTGSTYSADTAAMDAALGISGYTVEDFEDTALISGLTISFDGNIAADTSFTTLPKTFDSAGEPQTANNFWDGTRVLTNAGNGQNGPFLRRPPPTQRSHWPLPPRWSGRAGELPVGHRERDEPVSGDRPHPVRERPGIGTVEALAGANWTGGITLRNAYLRIEGTDGDLITSVRFRNDTGSDFLVFDRFAVFADPVQAVPEPSALLLFGRRRAVPRGVAAIRLRPLGRTSAAADGGACRLSRAS